MEHLTFWGRLILGVKLLFRVLVDVSFSIRARALFQPTHSILEVSHDHLSHGALSTNHTSAIQTLSLLQQEGRFLDFIQQDISTFSNEQIGSVARVVHRGCNKMILDHFKIESISNMSEGSPVTISDTTMISKYKISGNIPPTFPYHGVLRHHGWKVVEIHLPKPTPNYDATVLAPAEVDV